MEPEKIFSHPSKTEYDKKFQLITPYQEAFEFIEKVAEKIKQKELTKKEAEEFFSNVFFKNLKKIEKSDFFEQLSLLVKIVKLKELLIYEVYEDEEWGEPSKSSGTDCQEIKSETKEIIETAISHAEMRLSRGIIYDINEENRSIENLGPEKSEILFEAMKISFMHGNIYQALAIKNFFNRYDSQFQKLRQGTEKIALAHKEMKDFFSSRLAELHLVFSIGEVIDKDRNFLFEERGREAMVWIRHTLQKYGLPPEKMLESWFSHQEHEPQVDINISQIFLLEGEKPGLPKFLYQAFGIRNFERYPTKVLSAMLKEYEDLDKPYGILINPTNDWNGAFSTDYSMWERLFVQLQEQGYGLRIVEANGKFELAKHLVRLDRKYGLSQKISFAIIGGHGIKDSIQFGGSKDINKLYVGDLLGPGTKKVSHFFEKEPTIILSSCSTGKAGGIGEKISQAMNAEVIAPEVPTNIKAIEITKGADRLGFEVEFEEKKSIRMFKSGREVK